MQDVFIADKDTLVTLMRNEGGSGAAVKACRGECPV